MNGIESAGIETIEIELRQLQDDLLHIQKQIEIYRQNLHFLEDKAAKAGGEGNLNVQDNNELKSARQNLKERELERDEIQQKLSKKKLEIYQAEQVEKLQVDFDLALNNKQPKRAEAIANRLRSLKPSLTETLNPELIRFYWQLAIETSADDYDIRRKAWERVEKICYELGDEEGLHGAHQQLANLFEDRGEAMEDQGEYRSAANFYHRALNKYNERPAEYQIDRQRVLEKLIRASWNSSLIEAALRHSLARLQLLQQLNRPHDVDIIKSCFFQALDICLDLTNESRRTSWEDNLARTIVSYLENIEDSFSLQEIVDYSTQYNRETVHKVAVSALTKISQLRKPVLRLVA